MHYEILCTSLYIQRLFISSSHSPDSEINDTYYLLLDPFSPLLKSFEVYIKDIQLYRGSRPICGLKSG